MSHKPLTPALGDLWSRLERILSRQGKSIFELAAYADGKASAPAKIGLPLTTHEWSLAAGELTSLPAAYRDFAACLVLLDTAPVLANRFLESSLAHQGPFGEQALRLAVLFLDRWDIRSVLGPGFRIAVPNGQLNLAPLGAVRFSIKPELRITVAHAPVVNLWVTRRQASGPLLTGLLETGRNTVHLESVSVKAGVTRSDEIWLRESRAFQKIRLEDWLAVEAFLEFRGELGERYEKIIRRKRLPDVEDIAAMADYYFAHGVAAKALRLGAPRLMLSSLNAWIAALEQNDERDIDAAGAALAEQGVERGLFPASALGRSEHGDLKNYLKDYAAPHYEAYVTQLQKITPKTGPVVRPLPPGPRTPKPPPPPHAREQGPHRAISFKMASTALPSAKRLNEWRLSRGKDEVYRVSYQEELRRVWIYAQESKPLVEVRYPGDKQFLSIPVRAISNSKFYFVAVLTGEPAQLRVTFGNGKVFRHRF